MRFNLEDLNPPTWFDHAEDEEARICLRLASGEDMQKVRKQTEKKRVEYKRGERFQVVETDDEKASELTWQLCIVDWEGLYDNEDNPIPCTDENKVKLMIQSPVFSKWVVECLEVLNENHQQTQASAEKNLSSSQSE